MPLAGDLESRTGHPVLRDQPLAARTTMRVGGTADLLFVAPDLASFAASILWARERSVPLTLLGRGSDVVVADAGIRGLVVICQARAGGVDGTLLRAEAGLAFAKAATMAVDAGLSGLEFGLAIPGSVGGAVWANAGAHGADVASVLESATILHPDGRTETEPAAALGFSYRHSRLKPDAGAAATPVGEPWDVVLSATFALTRADPVAIRERADEIKQWRREHQPLTQPSAGSVFQNPEGDSAGRLIDAAGLRGAREGGAQISRKHANFIVNAGGATAADVRHLAERARAVVAARFGVSLVFEVEFVGDWSGWQEESVHE